MIGINIYPLNSGIGKYSSDINRIIRVYSLISNKNKLNYNYAGNILYGIYPPLTSGWAINNSLLPIYLKLKNISENVHLLSPINNTGLKGIVTFHDLYFIHRKLFNEIYFHYLFRKFHKWHIIAVSENTKNELIKYFNYNENQINVIPLSVDKNVFHSIFINRTNDVLTVGDGIHKNNFKISKLCKDNNLTHIHIGKDLTVNKTIKYQKVNNSRLNYLYNLSKVTIRYSDIEGFGIPAIESIFAGTPIILKRIPVFEEIMGKEYPLFVKDIDEIPEKVKEAENFRIKDYFKREWFENYSLETFIKRMQEVYSLYD